MKKAMLMTGGVLCFFAVALGAFGAHALKAMLVGTETAATRLAVYETANRYHFFHALGLILLALTFSEPWTRLQKSAAILFGLGIVLFSGSLYGLAVSGNRSLGLVTPLGGVCFLGGWLCFVAAVRRQS